MMRHPAGRSPRTRQRGAARIVGQGIVTLLMLVSAVIAPPMTGRVAAQEGPSVGQSGERTFASYGYADRTLTAPFGTISYWLPISPSVLPRDGSELHLRYRPSPSLIAGESSMTVFINGTPVVAVPLGGEPAAGEVRSLTVPLAEFLSEQSVGYGFDVTIQASLRTTDDRCEPTLAANRWLTILAESSLALNTGQRPAGLTLANLPALFMPPVGTAGLTEQPAIMEPVTIVLSPVASTEEIEAAGLVALALGQWAGRIGVDVAVMVQQLIPPEGPVVVVASGERFAANVSWGDVIWNGERFTTPAGEIPQGSGILSLQPGTVPRLLITGVSRHAVRDAARALSDPNILSLLTGSHAVLNRVVMSPPSQSVGAWNGESTSFQELGATDLSVTGAGTQTLRYHWDRPADWEITDGAELVLAVSTGPAVGPDSAITVRLNGQELGTAPLAPPDLTETEHLIRRDVRFPIPPDLVNVANDGTPIRGLDLEIEVFLAGSSSDCASPDAFPFATILGLSRWSLPHDPARTYDLARFPAPLYGDDEPLDRARGLIVVVPNEPNANELAEGINVMAALGRWEPYQRTQPPRLLTHRWLSATDRAAADLVLIGPRDRNPNIDEFFRRRPSLAPERLQPPTGPAGSWAPLILTDSPWSTGDAAVLVLPTIAADQSPAVASVLTRGEGLAQLRGTVIVTMPDAAPQPLQPATERTEPRSGGLLPSNGSAAVNLLWVVLILLVAIVGYRIVRRVNARRRFGGGTGSTTETDSWHEETR